MIVASRLASRRSSARPPCELGELEYDIATFTGLSGSFAPRVRAKRRYVYEPGWRNIGEVANVHQIASSLGWHGELPPPFAVKSSRYFDIAPGTIAIHPGCKPNWPWKKWHGFAELARLFRHVAIVGTRSDLQNSHTYFERAFEWPEHALNFVGELPLRDTAALLSQCAALVAPDSGLMHLGVALRVPTFGIFGITSPERECVPSPYMIAITKELPCEPACRRLAGRRDCEYHLECLKTLSPLEVASRLKEELHCKWGVAQTSALPATTPQADAMGVASTRVGPGTSTNDISVNYHCSELLYASGYGQAARGYIRALHAAGVRVHIVRGAFRRPEVEDSIITSLPERDPDADFQIFHGVPLPRKALGGKSILITRWDADRIPPAWRSALNDATDVWVPSAFNVEVFEREMGRAPFCLPYPTLPFDDGLHAADAAASLGVNPTDFVFYSVFKWQDRKNPQGLLEAFLRAFPQQCNTVLVIKTNVRAAAEANRVLLSLRAQTASSARVHLYCAAFSSERMRTLYARGDCYVSLHRGESWGYPLFDAAARGTPVIATGYGAPVGYLAANGHWLVRNVASSVARPYYLYQAPMAWCEPDLDHAIEAFRWVNEHCEHARARAQAAAADLRASYSLECIGRAAKSRLLQLKGQSEA